MKKKEERINKILELLTDENKIEVAALSEKLQVSQVTIRKDLADLEKRGIITREHGYAVLANIDDLGTRIAYHYEIKKKIAAMASSLLQDGDTIMIESGSCCALLADVLTQTHKDLTIITNSAFIAAYIRRKTNFQIILLGGIYQNDSQVMVGPMIADCVRNFCVDKFFIGADGFSPKRGFTNKDQLRAQAVRDMAGQASEVIVLTESNKFSRHGTVSLNLQSPVNMVITDNMIPGEVKSLLSSQGTKVITVSQ